MCRILSLMLEGGAIESRYHGELVEQRGRWYVGTTAVNPAAADALLKTGLLCEVLRTSTEPDGGSCRCFELSESTRRRITQQLTHQSDPQPDLEFVCATIIDSAFTPRRATTNRPTLFIRE